MPKRFSKQPIFISVECKDPNFNVLTGKYYFSTIKNDAAVFIREEGKLDKFDSPPYYLAFYEGVWCFQPSDVYNSNESSGWLKFATEGSKFIISVEF